MFTLGSFFSAFTLHNSNLEELSKKEDLTLEEILDEDNIVQEVKSAPQKFAKIIQQHPNLIKSMLDYIIKEPSPYESDQKKCFKYPFITSEIFGAEVKGFINMFFDLSTEEERGHFRGYDGMDAESDDKGDDHEFKKSDDEEDEEDAEHNKHSEEEKNEEPHNEGKEVEEEHEDNKEGSDGTPQSKSKKNPNAKRHSETLGTKNIDYLFKFLESKEILNTTLAGYFQKAVNAFLNKRADDFFAFLFNNVQHQDNLVRHVSTKSISDILIRVFMMDISSSDPKGNESYFLNERKEMINKLFEKFAVSEDHEEQENISNIFSEIINKNNNCDSGKDLVETIASEKSLGIIFKKILSNDSYPILYAASILLCLVQHYYQDKSSEGSPSKKIEEDDVLQSDFDYNALFSTLEKNLPSIIEILQQDSNINEFSTSFGARVKPLGCGKLKLIELLNYCLKITTPPNLINILLEKKIFGILLKLCSKFEWNNFLHSSVEKIIFTALESEHADIRKGLLEDYNIIDELIRYVLVEDFQVDSKVDTNLRRGYRAYFIKILKYIQKLSFTNDHLKKKLEDSSAWKDFEETTLKKINEDENKDLGGHNPKKSKQPDEENDNSKLELDIQKIYQRFSHYFSSSQQKDDDNDDMDMDNQEIYEDIDKHNGDGDGEHRESYLDENDSYENHIQNYQERIDKEKAEALQRGPEISHRIEEEEINSEYSLNSYWKTESHLHHDIDELMASNGL